MANLLLVITVASFVVFEAAGFNCSQDSGELCPASFPLRSDPSSADNCGGDGAEDIRQQIQREVTTVINDQVKPQLNEILSQKYLGRNRRYPAQNCTHILDTHPGVESGMYWLRNTAGTVFMAYCDFTLVCDSSNRTGWMRIANLDLTDSAQTSCPNDQFMLTQGTERYCERTHTGGGCNEHTYSVLSIPYTRVCGRATGLQIGGTDGFFDQAPNRPINEVYVDGVSLTYNNFQNVLWTFVASYTDDVTTCPCSSGSINIPPSYVMNNYFCESGAPNSPPINNNVYYDDKLWDGNLCRSEEAPCCSGDFNPPWFFRDVGIQTSDIKMRLCSDMGGSEEVGLTQLFLYIQ